jgi:hypothetical protein
MQFAEHQLLHARDRAEGEAKLDMATGPHVADTAIPQTQDRGEKYTGLYIEQRMRARCVATIMFRVA